MFATFLVSWFITRHVLFNLVIWSTIHDLPVIVGFNWVPEEGRYLTMGSHLMFCIFLVALQVRISVCLFMYSVIQRYFRRLYKWYGSF
jgi:very-long-chain ceramide synthase